MAKHLRSRLLEHIRKERRPNNIIHTFTANLITMSRTQFLTNLRLGKTQIWICTECASIGINLPDIHCGIQFKISDYIMLPELFQQLRHGERDASRIAVAIVFIEMWQILPNNVHILEKNVFKDLWLPVIRENCDQTTDVIARLYCKHIRSNAPKTGNLYQRTNLAVLWFLNTTSCWRQMILACFICKMAFDNRMNYENCCDNCIYNCGESGQVSVSEAYNVIAKLGIMYTNKMEYSDLLFSGERQRLLAGNPPRGPKTVAKQTYACKEALINFALQI